MLFSTEILSLAIILLSFFCFSVKSVFFYVYEVWIISLSCSRQSLKTPNQRGHKRFQTNEFEGQKAVYKNDNRVFSHDGLGLCS